MPHSFRRRGSTRTLLIAAVAAATTLASGCGGDGKGGVGPNGVRGIQMVAGAGITDTITAEPTQSLVVEVRDERGEARSGIVVRFEPLAGPSGYPYDANILVGALDQRDWAWLVVDTTDSRGRASARIKLGGTAGPASVQVAVPDLGMVDTAHFTVKPGAGARVIAAPKDTALYAGRSFSLRGSVVDRFGNPTAGTITYSFVGSAVTLSGKVVTGQTEGRAKVIVTALANISDTTYVSVLPEGVLAAFSSDGIVMFNTDGSGYRKLATSTNGGMTTDWSPNGSEVVFDSQFGDRIRVVDLAGNVRYANSTGGSGWEIYPEFAPDGRTIYYSKESWRMHRVNRDGTGDELVPTNSPSSDVFPSLSPDGTRMVYVVAGGGGQDALRLLTLATGEVTVINVPGHSPSWSPTGDRIAFLDPQSYALKVMNPDGTGVRQVSQGDASYGFGIDWSPDGRWIVAKNGRNNMIELVDATNGVTLPLGFTNGMNGPSWRP